MEIRPLTPVDHPAAARIITNGYRRMRRAAPALPAAWADPDPFEAELRRLASPLTAYAAVHRGQLMGHFGGFDVDWAGPASWTPEWAWSARASRTDPGRRRTVIHDLYAAAAEGWTTSGMLTHWISVFATDREAVDALTWLGFGHDVVNAVRGLEPVPGRPGIHVRRAGGDDVPLLQELEDGLREHLTRSPTLLPLAPRRSADEHRRRAENPHAAVLLAEVAGDVAGYLLVGPCADDIARIVQDERTASISGAFVLEDRRRLGVAETLLGAAVEWARAGGYERVGVDFETANLLASRFWVRHFTPVTFAMVRRLASPPGR